VNINIIKIVLVKNSDLNEGLYVYTPYIEFKDFFLVAQIYGSVYFSKKICLD